MGSLRRAVVTAGVVLITLSVETRAQQAPVESGLQDRPEVQASARAAREASGPSTVAASHAPRQAVVAPSDASYADTISPVSLERIRAGLEREPRLLRSVAGTTPHFRIQVVGTANSHDIRVKQPWQDDAPVRSNVQPTQTEAHREFMRLTTPAAARASYTAGGGGINILPMLQEALGKARAARREQEVKRIKQQIRDELAALEAANAAAGSAASAEKASKDP
jgi:hypothetical protein